MKLNKLKKKVKIILIDVTILFYFLNFFNLYVCLNFIHIGFSSLPTKITFIFILHYISTLGLWGHPYTLVC
jgi:hypothetical protein